MDLLLSFFLVIFVGLFSASVFRRLHFPWVVSLILGGIFIGPDGLNLFDVTETVEFMAQLGLTFLMFMAGLETQLSSFKKSGTELYFLAFMNGVIPLLAGLLIGYFLGLNPVATFLVGTVFVSSSVAVVIPTLEVNDLFKVRLGKAVMSSSIIQDVASLVMLSVLIQNIRPTANLPLILLYPLLAGIVMFLRYLLPRIGAFLKKLPSDSNDIFQNELRSVMLILIGTVIVFELIGLHSIIAGFFTGLVLSDSMTDEVLIGKIRAISYGVFVPTFFILVGVNTSLVSLFEFQGAIALIALIVIGSMLSKLLSGFLGAKIVGYSTTQSLFFGVSSVPQLSTTLAVSYTASQLGIISPQLNAAFVALSVISTFLGPLAMSQFTQKMLKG